MLLHAIVEVILSLPFVSVIDFCCFCMYFRRLIYFCVCRNLTEGTISVDGTSASGSIFNPEHESKEKQAWSDSLSKHGLFDGSMSLGSLRDVFGHGHTGSHDSKESIDSSDSKRDENDDNPENTDRVILKGMAESAATTGIMVLMFRCLGKPVAKLVEKVIGRNEDETDDVGEILGMQMREGSSQGALSRGGDFSQEGFQQSSGHFQANFQGGFAMRHDVA